MMLRPLDLTVVVPTYNERGNVPLLFEKLEQVLSGISWEMLVVDDDSPDGTSDVVRQLSEQHSNIRGLRRIGRRGLASACIEGMLATPARYIAVMDADLQHDETILPEMFARIRTDQLDLVVASRNIEGGSMGDFARSRTLLSNIGRSLSSAVVRCHLSDPMSGFFIVDRFFFEEVVYGLSGIGFKILLDLVASCNRPVRLAEVPYRFRLRQHGDSKLDLSVNLEYLQLLLDKLIGRYIPVRYVLFVAVGSAGVLVHLAVLAFFHYSYPLPFTTAQAIATYVAMTFNFFLNNVTTFRDRRLRGAQLILGFFTYAIACSIGALTNISVAQAVFARGIPWWAAGLFGTAISSVWNYGVTAVLTWRRAQQRIQRARAYTATGAEAARVQPR